MRDDYYEILGIRHTASGAEVVSAFRRLSLKLHPDKLQAAGGSTGAVAQSFADVQEAYAILSDRAARRRYDERLKWILIHPDRVQHPLMESAGMLSPGGGSGRCSCSSSTGSEVFAPSSGSIAATMVPAMMSVYSLSKFPRGGSTQPLLSRCHSALGISRTLRARRSVRDQRPASAATPPGMLGSALESRPATARRG
mmetsp:Transcript_31414/g.86483  ORF Transcript_31414/g.86483 Transcript_31414/m.86483 type:complete len:197 (+) Transcript_31414:63-653(+)